MAVAYLSEPIDRHHPPFQLDIVSSAPTYFRVNEPKRFNYKKANYTTIVADLQEIDWNHTLTGNVEQMVLIFYQLLMIIIDRRVPLRRNPGKYSS